MNAKIYLISVALAVLGACAPDRNPAACTSDCRLDILLSEDPSQPPRVPVFIHVAGGQTLNLAVTGWRPAHARTLISFEQAAFEDEKGNPLHTLELITGYNHYRLRPFATGVCRPPQGCRYVIVNAGLAMRPAESGDHRLIIFPDMASNHSTE